MDDMRVEDLFFHEGKPTVIKDFRNKDGSYKRAAEQQVMASFDAIGKARIMIEDRIYGRRFEMHSELDFMEMVLVELERAKRVVGHVCRYIDGFDEPPNDGRYHLVEAPSPMKQDKPRFTIKARRLRG
jgi:hypothetical protein